MSTIPFLYPPEGQRISCVRQSPHPNNTMCQAVRCRLNNICFPRVKRNVAWAEILERFLEEPSFRMDMLDKERRRGSRDKDCRHFHVMDFDNFCLEVFHLSLNASDPVDT